MITDSATLAPPLSRGICGLLRILTRGAAPGDGNELCLRAGGGNRQGPKALTLPASGVESEWIPAPLLGLLENDPVPWSVGLALRHAGAATQIRALGAWFNFNRSYYNERDPARTSGKRWHFPHDEISAAVQRARALLAPSIVIDGRCTVVVLWTLAEPLDVRRDAGTARKLLQRLATAVGAVEPADDMDLGNVSIPVPGFLIANAAPFDPPVMCPLLDVDRVYALEEIEEALAGSTESPAAAARRARKQEAPK